jgi:hypothetical protein
VIPSSVFPHAWEQAFTKFEKAALRAPERHLTERSPRLQHFAEITAALAKRDAGNN